MGRGKKVRLVCLSDTHGRHRQVPVPGGDVLLHAGDFLATGRDPAEIEDFNQWLGGLPHRHKIVVAGNHDLLFERDPQRARRLLTHAVYLENSGVQLAGLRFWASPTTPYCGDWAFMAPRGGAGLRKLWDTIPLGLDVLLTHGPPFGTLDSSQPAGEHFGCRELTRGVLRSKPRLHVFGHVHGGRGEEQSATTRFVNCAMPDKNQGIAGTPIVVELG